VLYLVFAVERAGVLGRLSSSKSGRRSPSLRSNSGRRLSHQLSTGSESRFEFDIQKMGGSIVVEEGIYNVPKGTYWRLVQLNAPEWPYALVGTLGSVLAGLLNPIFAVVLSEMLRIYYERDHELMRREIEKCSLVFVGAGVASLGIYYVQYYYFGIMGENLTNRVRKMMLSCGCSRLREPSV
jgi:ATP-binding cassette subfamily B (MDR/TAP) protein 1